MRKIGPIQGGAGRRKGSISKQLGTQEETNPGGFSVSRSTPFDGPAVKTTAMNGPGLTGTQLLPELRATRVREPTPSQVEIVEKLTAYLESGLAVFAGCTSSVPVNFTDSLRAWVAARQSASAFTLIGKMELTGSEGTGPYPPLQDFAGVDKDEGPSQHITCSVGGFINSSVWSGKLMRMWIQAAYGTPRRVVTSGANAMSTTVDGSLVSNTAGQSDWIYEHSDGTRLEWWAVSVIYGTLRVALLKLDAVSKLLQQYMLAYPAMTEDDKDWMRAWIFRGAQWPQLADWQTVDPGEVVPSGGGLGYGWQVSRYGNLASIHSWSAENILDGAIQHYGSRWYRHDLVLGLSYPAGTPVWTAGLTNIDVGYLEATNQKGIVPWNLNDLGTVDWFLTDGRTGAPNPLPSDAEVFGWYDASDNWVGKQVTDSGGVTTYCYPEVQIPGCEVTNWENPNCGYGTGQLCVGNRVITVDGETARNGGDYPQCVQDFHFFGAPTNQDWVSTGDIPAPSYACTFTYNDPCVPPDSLGETQWKGVAQRSARTYLQISSLTHFGAFAITPVYGVSDAVVIVGNWGNTNQQDWNEIATVNSVWYNYQVRSKCVSAGEPSDPWIEIGDYQATANTPFQYTDYLQAGSGPGSKTNIDATLKANGQTLKLWEDSGGENTGAPMPEGDAYSGSGTIDLGGWGQYVNPDINFPSATPIRARQSAVEGILDACTTPACADRESTDGSAADPMPNDAAWIGRV